MNENQLLTAIANQLVVVNNNKGGSAMPITGGGKNECELLRIILELLVSINALP